MFYLYLSYSHMKSILVLASEIASLSYLYKNLRAIIAYLGTHLYGDEVVKSAFWNLEFCQVYVTTEALGLISVSSSKDLLLMHFFPYF